MGKRKPSKRKLAKRVLRNKTMVELVKESRWIIAGGAAAAVASLVMPVDTLMWAGDYVLVGLQALAAGSAALLATNASVKYTEYTIVKDETKLLPEVYYYEDEDGVIPDEEA